MWLLYLLPKNLLSYCAGKVMHLPLPRPLATWTIRIFSQIYNINAGEAEKNLDEYRSIGDFFVRRLKPGLRPVGSGEIVHPADSRITQMSEIKKGQLIQAKGKYYSAAELIGNQLAAKTLEGGTFITYYLCPTDYHRVHAPINGKIISVTYIPGHLWPVNDWSTENISELFCVNERVVIEIDSKGVSHFVVFVGATNVGKISLAFDSEIVSNQLGKRRRYKKNYPGLMIKKGEELGAFHMGSTVVVLYSPNLSPVLLPKSTQFQGKAVQMGGDF